MRLFNSNAVLNRALRSDDIDYSNCASYRGVFGKSLFFLLMTLIGVGIAWLLLMYNPTALMALLIASSIGTLVFGIISFFSVRACKVTGSIYCVLEGVVVGTISILVSEILEGAVAAALLATIATVAVVVFLFMSRIVKVGSGFIKFLLIFAISFIIGQLMFRLYCLISGIGFTFGIQLAFSLISTFLATLYLFFDLRNIENIVEMRLSKQYEWYASFGLIYTVLWLYIEILRIVVLIAGRRN